MVLILMGVSGSGKTAIGKKLSEALKCPFYDADDFHSPANRSKISSGLPLDDEDRAPWLSLLSDRIRRWNGQAPRTILACSALKEKYRRILSQGGPVQWIYLQGPREVIEKRLAERRGHFAPANLLESQFAALEEPADAVRVDIGKPMDQIVQELLVRLQE